MDYQDRGMQKWAGFYLAEHSQQIEQKAAKKEIKRRTEQTAEEVSQHLFDLWKQKTPGIIQLNQVVEDQYQEYFCYVVGFSEDEILLESMDGQVAAVPQMLIRHVDKVKHQKWYKEGVPFEE